MPKYDSDFHAEYMRMARQSAICFWLMVLFVVPLFPIVLIVLSGFLAHKLLMGDK